MADALLRITKIASTTRLSDRYLTVQIKDAPDQEQAAVYGRLAAVVEIEGSWQSNAQIGQTIINTLSRQYFRGTARDPLTNFEEALKRVNETLTQATHTGSTDWIGHLHAAIIVVLGNDIHIATTGNVYATLFRDTHATPMLDEHRDMATVPGKVFGTLLSGTIEKGDHLLIASSGLQKIATPQEIQHCFSGAKNADDSIANLSGLLRAKRGRWVQALCIDAEEQTDTATHTVVLEEGTGMQLSWTIDRLRSSVQRAFEPIMPLFHRTKASAQAAASHIVPKSKERIEQTKTWSNTQFDRLRQDTLPQLQAQSKPLLARARAWITSLGQRPPGKVIDAPTAKPTSEPMTENLIGKSIFAIRDYTAEPAQPESTIQPPTITEYTEPKKQAGTARRFPTVSLKALTTLGAKLEWRSILFGLIALILFLVLLSNIHVITRQRQNEQSKQEFLTQLNQLQDKLEEARLARVFNQPDKATAALQEVLTGLPPLLHSPVADGAKLLQEKARIETDTLTQTNRLGDLQQLAHFDGAAHLVRSGDLFALSSTDGAVLASLHVADTTTKPVQLAAGQRVAALTAYDGKAGIALLTNQGMSELDSTGTQLATSATASDSWKTGTAVASFFNNLYILNPTDNQVWKYTATKDGFGKAEGYITDGTQPDQAIDVAVDGELYLLNKDGSMLKFNRGKKETFTLAAPPAPTNTITNAKQLITTTDSSYLYLLDDNRVLRFDKSGHFQTQYAFKGIDSVDSIALDEPQKTFYVLSGGTIYSTPF